MVTSKLLAYPPNPIPLDLRRDLSDPHVPWAISKQVFAQMQSQTGHGHKFKRVQVLPTDPEWRFVWRYFHHDKPTQYELGRIYCIYERHQQQAFELNLSSQEREAEKFPPTWSQEARASQRGVAIARWKEAANVFSPFSTIEQDGRRQTWKATKVMPLWHGSSEEVCASVAESGFAYFGKKAISKTAVDPSSTDVGFFGSGIYFTNSARYSADIYSKGHLLLTWVSMREPFPVIGDADQTDMGVLKGGGAYKNYNAHYVSVHPASADPHEPNYYPCKPGEDPTCDEIVVFHKSQTLPRFWVELTVSLPHLMQPDDTPQFVEDLIPHLMQLLQNDAVDKDKRLRQYLNGELAVLMKLEPTEYLEESHKQLYAEMQKLLDVSGKVDRAVVKALTGSSSSRPSTTAASTSASLATAPKPMKKLFLLQPAAVSKAQATNLPSIAFGAAKWAKYFGEVGAEPPLPADIDRILRAECPFWPGKRIEETHLLTLIPATVDGKPFCLDLLGELIQLPKNGGHATKYGFYWDKYKVQIGQQSPDKSYWMLMSRDILEGTRVRPCKDKWAVLDEQRKGQPYRPPGVLEAATAILMEHVRSGACLFGEEPWTYTQCREQIDGWPGAVGGFGAVGLRISIGSHIVDISGGLAAVRKF